MRFLLFAGEVYYPSGGWDDFVSAHESLEKALAAAACLDIWEWWHIVDIETLQVVRTTDSD